MIIGTRKRCQKEGKKLIGIKIGSGGGGSGLVQANLDQQRQLVLNDNKRR